MDCQGAVELLIEELDRDLPAEVIEGVAEHLSVCQACRTVRDRFLRLRSAGDTATAIEPDEREELVAQARSRSGVHVVPGDGVGLPAANAPPAEQPVAEAGTPAIPGYEIIETIGSGAMGTVYKAHQVSMDRAVALKVVAPELSEDDEFMKRFLREARISGSLNHPNVVGVIDAGLEGGTYFLTMEYVEGRSVKDMIEADGPLVEKRAVDICLQVARALEHASAHELVHRDVKPENILVTPEGVAKLCDLGLSKAVAEAGITQDGTVVGTPFYIAPEQARGAPDLDGRALEDGGPIDAKLAPAGARREIVALRREVYAKANAELKRRIDGSADPVLEFDFITEGMPKSLVDGAGKKLGVEEADGK